jgi:hypothetical protein
MNLGAHYFRTPLFVRDKNSIISSPMNPALRKVPPSGKKTSDSVQTKFTKDVPLLFFFTLRN